MSATVTILRNVQKDWLIELVDRWGRYEDTTGITAATLDLRKGTTGAVVLSRSIAGGGITAVETGILRISGVTTLESATLLAGSYVGRLVMTIGGVPVPTQAFRVDVEERVAA